MNRRVELAKNIVLNNDYVRSLAIYDHLNECLILANRIKEQKNSIRTGDVSNTLVCLKEHFRNELADLYILLDFELDSLIVDERIDKFIEKAKEVKA